ncbi:S41 family peptidase [Actinoplanes sp. NPDC024001]|uniref:S41 family peptidase n=1 Tax=Actinoplanes sp. NPDC024001 TaxID=3154598 RepID=UPI0033DB90B7
MRESLAHVAHRIGRWTDRLLPDRERAARLAEALDREFGGTAEQISAAGCRRIEEICHRVSRHLTLEFHAGGSLVPDGDQAMGWPPPDGAAIARAGGGVAAVERHADLAVLRVDSLESWEPAGPFVTSAFARTAGCRGLVLDLRNNGGGDMETLARIAGFVLGPRVVTLATVTTVDGVDHVRTTAGHPGWGRRAVVLTSERTYSSGEALAYVLQNRGVTVIGQATAGASDHCTPVRISPHVVALIPYGVVRDPVTGGNWEGTGVVPDLEVPPGAELSAAMRACADGARPAP